MAILVRTTATALARWRPVLAGVMPEREFRFWPDLGDAALLRAAALYEAARPWADRRPPVPKAAG